MKLWGIGQISPSEKDEILSKHKEMYNGYQTLYPNQPNTQPLYTFDSALDKGGLVVNNKGEVKAYTNFGINESTKKNKEELCSECGSPLMEGECMECGWQKESMDEDMCQECGSPLMEGECMECGWQKEMKEVMFSKKSKKPYTAEAIETILKAIKSAKTEEHLESAMRMFNNLKEMNDDVKDVYKSRVINAFKRKADELGNYLMKSEIDELGTDELSKGFKYKYKSPSFDDEIEFDTEIEDKSGGKKVFKFKGEKAHHLMGDKDIEDFVSKIDEDKEMCNECGSPLMEGECMECGWKQSDLDPEGGFDYIEGESNKVDVFKENIRTVEIPMKEMNSNTPLSYGKHYNEVKKPYDFKSGGPVGDGGTLRQKSLEEAGYTGGGNAPVAEKGKDAFQFKSGGPNEFDKNKKSVISVDSDDLEIPQPKTEEKKPYNFKSQGPGIGDAYPMNEDDCDECWEKMESAWSDEIDEVDVSGSQGVYGGAKKPYAFVSDGPGKGGPYQEHSWGGHEMEKGYEGENEDVYWEEDLLPNELNLDIEKFNPEDKSWEEITAHTGEDEFSHVDEEIKESLQKQKNKINEMFFRMKHYN